MDEEKVSQIAPETVVKFKDDLLALYRNEVFQRTYYTKQLRLFSGKPFDLVKWLLEQEEEHSNILRLVLSRGNIQVPDNPRETPDIKEDQMGVLQNDLNFEEATTRMYNNALEDYEKLIDGTDGALKEIIVRVRDDEVRHVEMLRDYINESKDL